MFCIEFKYSMAHVACKIVFVALFRLKVRILDGNCSKWQRNLIMNLILILSEFLNFAIFRKTYMRTL